MNISPEPRARSSSEQQDEHNYEDERHDTTMVGAGLGMTAGQGLMDDAMLNELLDGIQAAADDADDIANGGMDMDLDMSALVNFDQEDVEMGDAADAVDKSKDSPKDGQEDKSGAAVDDQGDGSKDIDVANHGQAPNSNSNATTGAKGKLMGGVILQTTNQDIVGGTSATVPPNGDETDRNVDASKVVGGDAEGERRGARQISERSKGMRCFVEESSSEPDETKATDFSTGKLADAPNTTTPSTKRSQMTQTTKGKGRAQAESDPAESASTEHSSTSVTAAKELDAATESQSTKAINVDSDANAAGNQAQQLTTKLRQDSAHGIVAEDTQSRHVASSAAENLDEAKSNDLEPRKRCEQIQTANDDDDLYSNPTKGASTASNRDELPLAVNEDSISTNEQMIETLDLGHEENSNEAMDFCYPTVFSTVKRPPLSLEALIVLALAETKGRSLTLSGITDRIKDTSRNYRDQDTGSPSENAWTKKVEHILCQYDFPTEPRLHPSSDIKLAFFLPEGSEWFVLNKPKKLDTKSFRLWKLPLEVRLKIYTFVLHLPLPIRCGWTVDRAYTLNPQRHESFCDPNLPPQRLTANVPGNWELRSRPIPEILALTMTSRAIQRESLPVFYRTNVFYFPQPLVMGRFLSGIPNRLLWIRNVILNFNPPVRNHQAKRSIGWLFSTKLRNLHLIVNEQELTMKHCVPEITDVPGVKFLAELSGLDKVGFSGECPNLKRYLAKANITSFKKGRGKNASEWDTDEEVEAQEGRRAKDRLVEMKKAFKNKARDAMRKESKMKKEVKRKQVAQRAADMDQKKKSKEETQTREKKRKREEKERKRQEREDELEEERERKEANRLAKKAASKRKAQAREEEKIARREERETTRAEKRAAADQLKKEKQRAAKKKIADMRKKVQKSLHADSDDDDGVDDSTEDEDSDAGPGTARDTKPNMGWYEASHPSSSSRSPDARQDSSSDDDEEPEPPKKKACTTPSNAPRGKAKATAPVSKPIPGRSSGQAPQKNRPVSNAMKIAAMKKTLQKGNSGAQVKTSVPAGPSRAPAVKSASKVAGNKKAEPVIVSDDGSSDDGESDDDDFD